MEECGACYGRGDGYDDMKQLAVKKTNELEKRIDGIKVGRCRLTLSSPS